METIQLIKKGLKHGTLNKSGISPDYANPGTYTGHWKLALDTGKLSICPRAKKLMALNPGANINLRHVLKLVHPTQIARLIREFRFACDNDCNFEIQVKIITPTGKIKWVRVAGVLYYRRWGTAEQMVGIIEDTTQKICEESLSMAVVNHELRSPLTIIKLNVQLLINMLSAGYDKYPVRLLSNVDQHINFMTKLIDEYLSSSLDEKRLPQNNLSVFDLNELIDTVVSEMKTVHTGNRFRKPSAMPIWVRADKYKIIQVLVNYFTNAVNFSPPLSYISVCSTIKDNHVEVAVHDQGVGVPQGQEQDIFQKFYKCEQKAVRPKNSKGLGLYLVKNIIEQHGGTVRAEKGVDCGSVFYFSLPLHRDSRYEQTPMAV
ncbi:MAG: PAS domain-containing sensor histidine kinase [Bacteroidota bacterium]|nr:PAS domain-containing sensor histidine kinase [Bacteroidota bacterium]